MSTSQNGWPVVGKSACDQGPFLGVKFPNGILAGDVATIARWQMTRYTQLVEPLVQGTCWGWYVKPIEGSHTVSNHASATAWDNNADQHPMGKSAVDNMSQKQIAGCRQIIREAGGVLRWGGDYTGRPDPMHWEIVGSPAAVAAFARKIRSEEDDVSAKDVWVTDGLIANPAWRADAATNKAITAKTAIEVAMEQAHAANVNSAAALTAVAQLARKDVVDEHALAAALAPAIAAQVLAALPADRDDITPDELQAAIRGVLVELVAPH